MFVISLGLVRMFVISLGLVWMFVIWLGLVRMFVILFWLVRMFVIWFGLVRMFVIWLGLVRMFVILLGLVRMFYNHVRGTNFPFSSLNCSLLSSLSHGFSFHSFKLDFIQDIFSLNILKYIFPFTRNSF